MSCKNTFNLNKEDILKCKNKYIINILLEDKRCVLLTTCKSSEKRTKVLILCGILLAFIVILSLPVSICTKLVKESDMRYRHLHLHLTFTFTFWVWWIFTHSNWSKHYHCIYIKLCAKLSIFITMFSWIRLLYVLCLKYRWNPFWVTRPIPSIMINWKLQ